MKMRKYICIILAVLISSGCSKENLPEENTEVNDMPVFEAIIGDADTKVQLGDLTDNKHPLLWQNNDLISIFVKSSGNSKYQLKSGAGSSSATFECSSPETGDGLDHNGAVYPYSVNNSAANHTDGLSFTLDIPVNQYYQENGLDTQAFPMVAVSDNTSLQFKNVCGLLKLQLYCDPNSTLKIKSITVKGNNGEVLAGRGSCTLISEGDPSTWTAVNTNNSTHVRLDCGEGVTLSTTEGTPTIFYIALPPVSFTKGFEITVKDTGGHIMTKKTERTDLGIVRSKITKMKAFKFEAQNITQAKLKKPKSDNGIKFYNPEKIIFSAKYDYSTAKPLSKYKISESSSTLPAYAVPDAEEQNINTIVSTEADEFLFHEYCYDFFMQLNNLKEIQFNDCCNTSQVTRMDYMFSECSNLQALDLSDFNTFKVTNMEGMFNSCSTLKVLDLECFNTNSVTDMSSMFSRCSNLLNLNISNFNTANVTDMSSMFSICSKLEVLDLSNFNTANVTNMGLMFSYIGLAVDGGTELILGPNFKIDSLKDFANIFTGARIKSIKCSPEIKTWIIGNAETNGWGKRDKSVKTVWYNLKNGSIME